MIKILKVTVNDIAGASKDVKFGELRIKDLNSAAMHEAFKSDIVIFEIFGDSRILKDRT